MSGRSPILSDMKTIELWRWRILWVGKWTKTRHHATEDEIRREHPVAVRVAGSIMLREVADTEQERRAALYRLR